MNLKLLKITLVDWSGFDRQNIANLANQLADVDYDVCVVERNSFSLHEFFTTQFNRSGYSTYFVETASIDPRLDFTGGSTIILRNSVGINIDTALTLPSDKNQTDAGHPTKIPIVDFKGIKILIGGMPQNLAREKTDSEITSFRNIIDSFWGDGNATDCFMIGVYNGIQYDIHTWQISIDDAIADDACVISYLRANKSFSLVELLNQYKYNNEVYNNFVTSDKIKSKGKNSITIYSDLDLSYSYDDIEFNECGLNGAANSKLFTITVN